MNPLPVSLDLTNNVNSKPAARASDYGDSGKDRFKQELDKQDKAASQKLDATSNKGAGSKQKEAITEPSEGETVAATSTKSGEKLPDSVTMDGQQLSDSETLDGEFHFADPIYSEFVITLDASLQSDELALPNSQFVNLATPVHPDSLLVNYNTALSDDVLSSEEVVENSLLMTPLKGGVSLDGTGAANVDSAGLSQALSGVAKGDKLLEQPTEKMMAFAQIKASLESEGEMVAELDIDVESSIRPGGQFSDIQLKESQSALKSYTTSVDVPVTQSTWGDKVSDKVMWLANQKIQYAEIHITPAELGPVEVKINVQNDQATVTFNSQHQGVRELLELNVNRLREMMGENGVDLAHVDVSDHSSQQRGDGEDSSDTSGRGEDGELLDMGNEEIATSEIKMDNLVDYYA